jgi:phenylacetate-CoA ligase
MRAGLEADQLHKLRTLLSAISESNSFYSAKLRGIDLNIPSLDWYYQRFPFTLKRELVDDQRANPPYGSNLTYPLDRYTRFSQTNGTTGSPLRWVDTPESWDWMVGNWTRVFQAAGVTAGDRIFFAFSFGPFLGFWVAFDAAARLGAMCIPGGGMRSEARLHAIVDNQATVVCCTPTYAIRLGETALEERIDLSPAKVRKIVVAGEPGGSVRSTQARIEELWRGARVFDHHGMTEVGPVSYACPKRERVLHVIESSYIAEVADPVSGQAVVRGELVLTNLGRAGSPLLRYRTGDIVQRSEIAQCECGSWDLALEGGILARTDDMVVVRGVNLYPSAIEDILRGCDGVSEYRVEIRTNRALTELTIQVEASDDRDAGLIHRLESALRNATSLRVPVSTVPRGTLPRFEMKAQRWIRLG